MKITAEKLKRFRRRHNMTQLDFAAAMEVTPTTVSRWECGTRTPSGGIGQRLENLRKKLEGK